MVLIELASDQEESYNVSPGHKEASTKGDFQVYNVSHSLQMKCDCSSCIQIECCEEIESLDVTRAKGKEKMKWDEQEKVRMKVVDQIDRY